MKVNINFKGKSRIIREKRSSKIKGVFYLLLATLIALVIHVPRESIVPDSELREGDIAQDDLIVQRTVTVADEDATSANRKKLLEAVIPVYEFNTDLIKNTRFLLTDWFEFLKANRLGFFREAKSAKEIKEEIMADFGLDLEEEEVRLIFTLNAFAPIDLDKLLEFVENTLKTGVLATRVGIRKSVTDTVYLVSSETPARMVMVGELLDVREVEQSCQDFLRASGLNSRQLKLTLKILMEFIPVNVTYSQRLTRAEEEKIEAAVIPVFINLKKGKVIFRKGDEISSEHLKLMNLIAAEEIRLQTAPSEFFLVLTILLFIFFLIWQLEKVPGVVGDDTLHSGKTYLVLALTLVVSAILYRIAVFLYPLTLDNLSTNLEYDLRLIFYAFPFATGAMTMAFLFNPQASLLFSFMNSLLAGMVFEWNLKVMLFVFIGNMTVALAMEYYGKLKRSTIIKAAFFRLLPVNVVLAAVMSLTAVPFSGSVLLMNMLMVVFASFLSALLAGFLISLWEILFKVLTDLRLVELSNLNLPVFREMLEKAPGTYHHSLMVASLADTTARKLNLSAPLLYAMALYHDIGKISFPEYFTENNSIYKNPHKTLSPKESARIIISHINAGIERAMKLKIPARIREAIEQHHGNKQVAFFLEQAKNEGPAIIDDLESSEYRYPGPKPQSIECAVVMLADQVEAASKSLSSPTQEEIENVVNRIIAVNVEENQFESCVGLTFQALHTIAASFKEKLLSIYQQRVPYPGFDFSKKNT